MRLKSISFLLISLALIFNYFTIPLSLYKLKQPNNAEIKGIVNKVLIEKISLKSNLIEAGNITAEYSKSKKPLIYIYIVVILFLVMMKKLIDYYEPWLEKYPPKNHFVKALIFNFSPAKKIVKMKKKECRIAILIYTILNFALFPLMLLFKFLYFVFIKMFSSTKTYAR